MTMPPALAAFHAKKKGGPPSPIAQAAASAKLAPPFGKKAKSARSTSAPSPASSKQPPEPQLGSIISSLQAAVAREPDDPDKRKLAQALSLVRQVNESNSKAGS